MKKSLLFLLVLSMSTATFAQNFLGMQIKKIGVAASFEQDRVENLDGSYFLNLSKNELNSNLQNQDFPKRTITSMTCENPAFRVDVTVLPSKLMPNMQLNLGTAFMLNRIDATAYNFWGSDYYGFENGGQNYSQISFYSYSHEAALDASLVFHKKFAFLHLYGGAGTNLGYTFAGDMEVDGYYTLDEGVDGRVDSGSIESSEQVYFIENSRMKNSVHQRAFLQAGVSVIFLKRLELGLEMRRGIGYRYNSGNPAKFTNLVGGGLNLRWNLL